MTKSQQRVQVHIKSYEILVRYAASITKDWALSEDIVQEAFLRFDAKSPNNAESYLRRIVHNLSIDHLRKQQRELQRFDHETPVASFVEQNPTQESALAQKQELELVLTALAELPEITRRVVEMHRLEGLKLREIASSLNLSVTQTHEHLHRGIKHCMRVLNAKK
ncbi:RNA polymerase sigma factor [Pseudovibrio denitrificans]|uniref:RNA polymerase sigma factor n=1 Tax=Pseudovibrio denitrificans TaxID=258256 RepID=UPI0006CF3155|nr:sigma-70 family RNA polymerase sigma factor [Pseudovibrio denitrificans]